MRFYTYQECDEWSRGRARKGPEYPPPPLPDVAPNLVRQVLRIPDDAHVLHHFARAVAREIQRGEESILFWATDWSNYSPWHLYYKLRQTYGDFRLLHEAPGHFFLPHETEDLVSFLSIAMANYWDGYLLTELDYPSAVLEDVFIDFCSDDEESLGFVDGLRTTWPKDRYVVPGNR